MPSDVSDLYQTALDLARRGDLGGAQAALSDLLTRAPADPAGWSLQGVVRLQRGRFDEAAAAFDRAVALGADDPRTHLGRGLALLEVDRNADAVPSFDRAIALDPSLIRAHTGRARALNVLGRLTEALESADRALALDPAYPEAWRRRGLALFDLDRTEEALIAFQAMPTTGSPIERSDTLTDLGLALQGVGRYEEAMAAFDEAVAVAPGAWLAPCRRSFLRLFQGDFAGGWADYEARWRRRYMPANAAGHMTAAYRERLTLGPRPEDLAGQRVLVVAEQGIGDVVMFASLLPDLVAIAAQVTCLVEHRLLTLFSVSFPGVEVVAGRGPGLVDLSRIDRVVAIGSLPHAFRQTPDAFPGQPYLRPTPATVEAWRERLGPANGRQRIGVSWRGGAPRTRGAARSMSLDTLRPLLERPDCDFVSLQYGDVAAEIAEINGRLGRPILGFPKAQIDDFEQLAGLISALDAVVTVQTTVAHLTGAVGRRGLVMIPERAEWRYGQAGSTMPWYRSLRLFRQDETAAWEPVIAQVGAALDRNEARPNPA